MNCSDCEARLIEYAHGELEGEAHTSVARHLAGCSDCALEYCRLQADLAGIVEAHAETPRARVYHVLRRRVAAEHGSPWWDRARRALARPVPVYGAVLAGLLPVVVWIAIAWSRPGPETAADRAPAVSRDAALTDYDATEVQPAYRDVL